MEYPKSLPQECLYYSMISVDRHRLLMLTVFTEGTRKSCAFVDKRTEEVLVLTEKVSGERLFVPGIGNTISCRKLIQGRRESILMS